MEPNWSTGGSSSEAGGSSSSTHNPSAATPYTDVGGSSSSAYTAYPPYSYAPPTSAFAPYHSSSSYAFDYSGFAPYTHAAYASDSGTGRHSISFPPQYASYSQLLMSTSPMHAQSLAPFFTETQEQHDTQPTQHDTIVPETQQPEPTSTSTSTTTKERAKTSAVWNHFVLKIVEGRRKAECKYCHQLFDHKEGYGTGVLNKHYEKKHAKSHGLPPQQAQILADSGTLSTWRYKPEVNKHKLAEFIVRAELPFSFTESDALVDYLKSVFAPDYKRISRQTITREIEDLFVNRKNILKALFTSDARKISLTSDIWEALNLIHYLCVTAHFIDENWILQKRILSFSKFSEKHSATNVANSIFLTCRNYGIENKIFSISFDNASENTASIRQLKTILDPILNGKLFHVRCVCHILNLCVQDGLKLLDKYIYKVKEIILHIKHSGPRRQSFKGYCRQCGLKEKLLQADVKTRWNSSYYMIKDCLPFKQAIQFFTINECSSLYISDEEWKLYENFCTFLEKFDTATKALSGTYYPTCNLVFYNLNEIAQVFAAYRDDDSLEEAIHDMEEKFRKYFENMPFLFYLAAIMDPRIKIDNLKLLLSNFILCLNYEQDVDKLLLEIRSLLEEMYSLYRDELFPPSSSEFRAPTPSQTSSSSLGKRLSNFKSILSSNTRKKHSSGAGSFDELNLYLNTMPAEINENDDEPWETFDVLSWWKEQRKQFPVLSTMARDILTPPASTVASESAFSAGGRVLTPWRSRLTPKHLEMAVCLKDWFDAERRTQGKAILDEEFEQDEDDE